MMNSAASTSTRKTRRRNQGAKLSVKFDEREASVIEFGPCEEAEDLWFSVSLPLPGMVLLLLAAEASDLDLTNLTLLTLQLISFLNRNKKLNLSEKNAEFY